MWIDVEVVSIMLHRFTASPWGGELRLLVAGSAGSETGGAWSKKTRHTETSTESLMRATWEILWVSAHEADDQADRNSFFEISRFQRGYNRLQVWKLDKPSAIGGISTSPFWSPTLAKGTKSLCQSGGLARYDINWHIDISQHEINWSSTQSDMMFAETWIDILW